MSTTGRDYKPVPFSVTAKSTTGSLIRTLWEPSVNRKDLKDLTLVGPIRDSPVPDLLAVYTLTTNYA